MRAPWEVVPDPHRNSPQATYNIRSRTWVLSGNWRPSSDKAKDARGPLWDSRCPVGPSLLHPQRNSYLETLSRGEEWLLVDGRVSVLGYPYGKTSGWNPVSHQETPGSIPALGRSSGEGIGYPLQYYWASLVAQLVKNPPATWVQSLGWKDPLEKRKATQLQYSGLEESMDCIVRGLQRVRHDWVTFTPMLSWFTWKTDIREGQKCAQIPRQITVGIRMPLC